MTIPRIFRNKLFLAIMAVMVLAGAASAIILIQPSRDVIVDQDNESGTAIGDKAVLSKGDISIEPLNYDSAGIDTGTAFKIKVNKEVKARQLMTALSVKPQQSFDIKSTSADEFLLSFEKPLEADSIYRFALNERENTADYMWAFQTKKEFRILRTLPRDKGTGVPANSGIEITFSHEGVQNLEKHFEISPKVEGRFEYHKKVAVFVPKKLEYGTIYTVTIRKGLGLAGSEEKTKEDTVFQFQTQYLENQTKQRYFGFAGSLFNFTSLEAPVLTVHSDDYYKDTGIPVEIYSYKNTDSFIKDIEKHNQLPSWAQKNNTDLEYDKTGLEKVMDFKTKVLYTESPWYQQLIELPDKLPQGWYLVSVVLEGREYNAHMQINDLSVYIMAEKENAMVWVNNSRTGEPEKGTVIEADGIKKGTTDHQGIARIDAIKKTDDDISGKYLLLKPEKGYPFVARFNSYYGMYDYGYFSYTGDIHEKYWSYLYLDRGMYLPDDTIKVWGLAKPRGTEERPEKITLQLMKYSYHTGEEAMLLSQELDISPYGTYSGELSYKNFNPGSYYVVVKYESNTLEQRYISIENYVKPAYTLEPEIDKKFCYTGETVNVGVQASFFEGSPVSGLELDYSISGGHNLLGREGKITCGNDGKAALSYRIEEYSPGAAINWRPVYTYFIFRNANSEETNIQTGTGVNVFPRDMMIDITGKIENGNYKISAKTNKIDITRIKDNENYWNTHTYRGEAVDTSMKVRIIEHHWEKESIGQYYDFINKVSRERYRYYRVTNTVDEFELSTVNGIAEYTAPCSNFSVYNSYEMVIESADTLGRKIKFNEYLYTSNVYEEYLERMEMSKYYSLAGPKDKNNYKLDEPVALQLLENEKEFAMPSGGRVLYMTLKSGLVEYKVSESNRFDTSFKEELIPNAHVKAIYFDGTNVYNAGSAGLYYDYGERTLNLELKPDKDRYRPGDTVNIDINVTDKSGKPYAAEVNLSVVDEAFFALWNQWVDTPSGIYSYVFGTGIYGEYISYNPVSPRYPYAECGEGGDDALIRSDFKDNAFFGNVITDSNGKGRLSFQLPHNLTSWRVTGQAVTKELKAGNVKINIDAALPFFTTLIFNDIYLEGDSPSISLRSYGTELKSGSSTDYKVTLESSGGYRKVFTGRQSSNSYCNIALEELAAGDYSITVEAVSGDLKDIVKKDFKVVTSMLETARTKYFDLKDGVDLASDLDISSENSIVDITFYNKNMSRYKRVLNALGYSWGSRVDQVLSRVLARDYLKKYFGKEYPQEDESADIRKYQLHDGGIALLTYDSSDPVLSAKLCALGGDYFNTEDLAGYLTAVASNKDTPDEEIAAAYYGLASLGKPVLLDIRAYLKEEDLSLREKLYLGMALAEIGELSGVQPIYDEVMKAYGKVLGEQWYIEAGDKDETVEMTSMMSLMALKLNAPEKDGLFDYIVNKSANDILVNIEKMQYLKNTVPEVNKTGSFTYTMDGKKETVTLKNLERKTITTTIDMLKKASFTGVTGEMEAAVEYTGPMSALSESTQSPFAVSRKYQVKGERAGNLKQSDVVEVTLNIHFDQAAPEGYYQITDVLPSGMRFVSTSAYNQFWYLEQTDKQILRFGYHYTGNNNTSSMRYYARIISPGTYTADDAVIKHAVSQAHSFSGREKMEIGD